jgi:hypothetical protein
MMILICYPFRTFIRASVKSFLLLDCYCKESPLVVCSLVDYSTKFACVVWDGFTASWSEGDGASI